VCPADPPIFADAILRELDLIHIFGKLGGGDRTAAVVAALEWGIIRLPGTNPLNQSMRI
jgi:hypothetical protein